MAISLLAPGDYYQDYGVLDDGREPKANNSRLTRSLLCSLAEEFEAEIAVYLLPITIPSFNNACSEIYDQQGLKGQQVGSAFRSNGISALSRDSWVELISSE